MKSTYKKGGEIIQTGTWRLKPGHIRPKTAINIVEKNKTVQFKRKHSGKRELKLSSPEVLLKNITVDEFVVSSTVAFPSLLNSMISPSKEEIHNESGTFRRPIFVKSHPVSLNSENIKTEVIFFKEKAMRTPPPEYKSLLSRNSENHVYKSKNNKYEFRRRMPERSISIVGENLKKKS